MDLTRARGGAPRRVQGNDGLDYFQAPPKAATKVMICPGCGRNITVGQTQVAVWEADSLLGATAAVEMRRHWHLACWRSFTQ
ncbi:MAG: hypothetical protein LBH68_08560 [Bifidobacteriaceae bacterium]|nr:hypothetical protein [Bifidobacteriaceae bacterium]